MHLARKNHPDSISREGLGYAEAKNQRVWFSLTLSQVGRSPEGKSAEVSQAGAY